MSPTETVRTFYSALGHGDAPAALALLCDKLEWTEADGFPYFSDTWRTAEQVVENLLVPLAKDWEEILTGTFVRRRTLCRHPMPLTIGGLAEAQKGVLAL